MHTTRQKLKIKEKEKDTPLPELVACLALFPMALCAHGLMRCHLEGLGRPNHERPGREIP